MVAHVSDLIATDIDSYLASHEQKELLRFITCGSVDDGKSTLIGRMLYESQMLFDDHLAALEADSKRVGTQEGEIDFALLVDGLAAEREQGITIDVAYRFFSTDKRKYIVADTPGHEEYTRNMATGASTADVAIILVDASQGVLTQTRRHSFIVSMVGVKKIILAINKLDLVDYSQEVYNKITEDFTNFANEALVFLEYHPGGQRPASVQVALDGQGPKLGVEHLIPDISLENKVAWEDFNRCQIPLPELALWGHQQPGTPWG